MRQRLNTSELFLKAQTDERLAALAREGHTRAFAVLVDRHRRALLAHAGRMVGSNRAEDVLQQALLKAWRSLDDGTEVRHAQAWLHRIVHNAALTDIERQPENVDSLSENLSDSRSAASAVEQQLAVREVLRGLADLPQRQRLALLGTELEGRSRRQIAAEMGLTEGAVRQLVHRARTQVRAGIAVVVPFPLVERMTRASGWLRDPAGTDQLRPAAEVMGGSGILAGGAVKLAAVVIAAGAVGGGALLHTVGHVSGHRSAARSAQRPGSGLSATQAGHGATPIRAIGPGPSGGPLLADGPAHKGRTNHRARHHTAVRRAVGGGTGASGTRDGTGTSGDSARTPGEGASGSGDGTSKGGDGTSGGSNSTSGGEGTSGGGGTSGGDGTSGSNGTSGGGTSGGGTSGGSGSNSTSGGDGTSGGSGTSGDGTSGGSGSTSGGSGSTSGGSGSTTTSSGDGGGTSGGGTQTTSGDGTQTSGGDTSTSGGSSGTSGGSNTTMSGSDSGTSGGSNTTTSGSDSASTTGTTTSTPTLQAAPSTPTSTDQSSSTTPSATTDGG